MPSRGEHGSARLWLRVNLPTDLDRLGFKNFNPLLTEKSIISNNISRVIVCRLSAKSMTLSKSSKDCPIPCLTGSHGVHC